MLSSALTRSLETLTLMIQVYALPSLLISFCCGSGSETKERTNIKLLFLYLFIYQGQGRHTTTTRLDLEN